MTTTVAAPPAGPAGTVGALTVADTRVWRLRWVPRLLDPDNPTLLDHLPSVRRLLVVAPTSVPYRQRLRRHLDEQCRRGRLDSFVMAPEASATAHPLVAIGQWGRAAIAAGLARRDAFLICGTGVAADTALLTAAMLRRHTPALVIVHDRHHLAMLTRRPGRTPACGEVGLQHRQLTVLVDEDTVGPDPTLPAESAPSTQPAGPVHADPPGQPAPRRHAGPSAGPCRRDLERITRRVISCRVQLAPGLLDGERDHADLLADWFPAGARVLAVVDGFSPRIVDATGQYLRRQALRGRLAGFTLRTVAWSPTVKSLPPLQQIVRAAARARLGRDDRILAVGGGAVLDLVGTAALLYTGGTPYLRLPTTLVGMIDAGIGLKVGIDLERSKNLLGGYHPPLACLCDERLLATLPAREIRCGLAEAVKIAAVTDADLFATIERHWADLAHRRTGAPTRRIISGSIQAMLAQLAGNPFEQDLRRLPDFGHEFGHLLEKSAGHRLRHGEAVAIGMAVSSEIAVATGRLAEADHARLVDLLHQIGLPIFDRLCTPRRLWRWLRDDICAHKGGQPHLVVPITIGAGGFVDSLSELDPDVLRRACASLAART